MTLDALVDATTTSLADEAVRESGALHSAPYEAVVRRLDEVRAARHPIVREETGDRRQSGT